MNEGSKEPLRHPNNAPGPFFVEDGLCITCGIPELEAPDLIAGTDDGHCYFRKQPVTPDEVRRAIAAVNISCCGAVQYGGDDPDILRQIVPR